VTAAALLEEAAAAGVRIAVRLWVDRIDRLDDGLRARLRAHYPEIVQLLTGGHPAHVNAGAHATAPSFAPTASKLDDNAGIARTPAWREGVARLGGMSAPEGIGHQCWARFQIDARLTAERHGADLLTLGWDELDVFGLHRTTPAVRSDCMGLAWLLNGAEMIAVSDEGVALLTRSGARLTAKRLGPIARCEAVPAWSLPASCLVGGKHG
jgi:hypothetical protein